MESDLFLEDLFELNTKIVNSIREHFKRREAEIRKNMPPRNAVIDKLVMQIHENWQKESKEVKKLWREESNYLNRCFMYRADFGCLPEIGFRPSEKYTVPEPFHYTGKIRIPSLHGKREVII